MTGRDDPEVLGLLDALGELVEAMRRLTVLSERLVAVGSERILTTQEAADATREIQAARAGVERREKLLLVR